MSQSCFILPVFSSQLNSHSFRKFVTGLYLFFSAILDSEDLPKTEPIKASRVNKNKIVEFYNKKTDEAIKSGNLDKAFELSCHTTRA